MFDTKLTAHLAELSKLEITPEELEKITGEMDAIVALMDTVAEAECNGDFAAVESKGLNELRADEPKPSMNREELLANAEEREDTYFKVPKVV